MAFEKDDVMVETDFASMSVADIKSRIVEYVKQIRQLEHDKKEFTGASNDAIKEVKAHISAALVELSNKNG